MKIHQKLKIIQKATGKTQSQIAQEIGVSFATFNSWIYGIMRSGFGTPSMAELNAYAEQLKVVFEKITYK